MKLTNSIKPLKDTFDMVFRSYDNQQMCEHIAQRWEECTVKCTNPRIAMRWNLWYLLTKEQRDTIILASISENEYVGGYFVSVRDSHIDVLLRRAFPFPTLMRLVTHCKLKAAKQGR